MLRIIEKQRIIEIFDHEHRSNAGTAAGWHMTHRFFAVLGLLQSPRTGLAAAVLSAPLHVHVIVTGKFIRVGAAIVILAYDGLIFVQNMIHPTAKN
jgi:hypothetical protein